MIAPRKKEPVHQSRNMMDLANLGNNLLQFLTFILYNFLVLLIFFIRKHY